MWTDPEEIAQEVYAVAGADVSSPPGVYALCHEVGVRVRCSVFGMRVRARLSVDSHGYIIHLAPRISQERRVFLVAHELAEWWAIQRKMRLDAVEQIANGGGAAIVAPAPAFKRAVQMYGTNVQVLAEVFNCTPTWAALRLAEVGGMSAALVTPNRVHRRGSASDWGSDEEIRTMTREENPWFVVNKIATGKYLALPNMPNYPMFLEIDVDQSLFALTKS